MTPEDTTNTTNFTDEDLEFYKRYNYKLYAVGRVGKNSENFKVIYFDVRNIPAGLEDACWFTDYKEAAKELEATIDRYYAEG